MPSSPKPRSPSSPAAHLLSQVEHAETELAMYAAIIGGRPTMNEQPVESKAADEEGSRSEPSKPIAAMSANGPFPRLAAYPTRGQRRRAKISLWIHELSHAAKKRLDEARSRLAS